MDRHEQSLSDRSEIKIKAVNNGWIFKSRNGWTAFTDAEELMEAVREEAVRIHANVRLEMEKAARLR